MSEHQKRSSLTSRLGTKGGLLAWSLVCTVTGAAIGFWSPLAITYTESLLGVDALSVVATYADSYCGGAVGLAGLDQRSDPGESVDAQEEPSQLSLPVWGDQGSGVVPYQMTVVRLTLESKTDEILVVRQIKPLVFRTYERALVWSVLNPEGCGGELSMRDYSGRLDATPASLERADESSSSGFTISRADPTEVRLELMACNSTYEFGFDIEYSVRGVTRTLQVASPDRPFIVADGKASRSYGLARDGSLEPYDPDAPCAADALAELESAEQTDAIPGEAETGEGADEFGASYQEACEIIAGNTSMGDRLLFGCLEDFEYRVEFEAACARAGLLRSGALRDNRLRLGG